MSIWTRLEEGDDAHEFGARMQEYINRPSVLGKIRRMREDICDYCDGHDQEDAGYLVEGSSAKICSICVDKARAIVKTLRRIDDEAIKKGVN